MSSFYHPNINPHEHQKRNCPNTLWSAGKEQLQWLQYVTETAPSRGKRGMIQVMRAECSNQCVYLIDMRVWTGIWRGSREKGLWLWVVSIRHVHLRQNVNNTGVLQGLKNGRHSHPQQGQLNSDEQCSKVQTEYQYYWSKLKRHNLVVLNMNKW